MQLALYLTIFLGILIVLTLFAQQYHLRFDLTTNKRHTLSPQSIKVLNKLQSSVKVIGFFTTGAEKDKAKDLLEQYAYHSKNFDWTFIDPERHPLEAKKYNIHRYNTLVVQSGQKREQIYEISEEKLTNAIVKVTRKGKKTIYFLKGHGEHEIEDIEKNGYSKLKEILNEKGYEVKPLLLVKQPKIPEDTALLVIAGPQKALLSAEIEAIKTYLNKGGSGLFLLEPETGQELAKLLKEKGIVLDNDIIVDKMSRLFGGDYLIPVVVKYNQNHSVTKGFNLACFFPLARSINIEKNQDKGKRVEILAWTSENSWGEKDLSGLKGGKAIYDEKDIAGPIPVAAASFSEEKNGFKLIVVGDSDFIDNTYLQVSGNKDLALNMINWLTEEQDLITIPPKKTHSKPLVLSSNQAQVLFWLPVIGLPLLVLLSGIVIYWKRRRL